LLAFLHRHQIIIDIRSDTRKATIIASSSPDGSNDFGSLEPVGRIGGRAALLPLGHDLPAGPGPGCPEETLQLIWSNLPPNGHSA